MNMTPMIDIVFLLIIFFMTVTQVSEINKERLELPQQQGTSDQQPTLLTINVTESGQVIVGGIAINVADLAVYVADILADQNDDPSRLSVVLRADRRGTSEMVNRVVETLNQLQIKRVRIAVETT